MKGTGQGPSLPGEVRGAVTGRRRRVATSRSGSTALARVRTPWKGRGITRAGNTRLVAHPFRLRDLRSVDLPHLPLRPSGTRPGGGTTTTGKTWSVEEKLQIVLEGMAPRVNIFEVCRRHDISSIAYYEWRAKALAGMKQGLKTPHGGAAETALQRENARRKKLVAEYALINDHLRETLEGRPLGKNDGG